MIPGHDLSYDQMKSLIHDAVDIGVHIESTITSKGIHRRIQEVVTFSLNEHHQPITTTIYAYDDQRLKEGNDV